MKGISAIKKNLLKLLKENNFKECNASTYKLTDRNFYVKPEYPQFDILSIFIEFGLSFHFGYDKITKTSASICVDGYQFDTEYNVLKYWEIAKSCICGYIGKEQVKQMLNL